MAEEVSVSSPAPASDADGNAPRRSGRATRKPVSLVEQQNASAKRKRNESGAQDADGDVDMDDDEDEDDEDELEDADEDERPKTKRARKGGKLAAKKSNGTGVKLAVRPAKSAGPKKPRSKKTARFSSAEEAGGLYCTFARRRKTCEHN